MRTLDLTFSDAPKNLACDEALLDACENAGAGPVLRFWEPEAPFVVLGYSNPARTEVSLECCRANGVPVLRRISGGGTVLQGRGCLNYSLVLPIRETGSSITATNTYVMEKNRAALEEAAGRPVSVEGHTDLCVAGVKFSGNSQRRRRTHLLFHGTILLGMDLGLIERCLPMPSLEPAYRKKRPHSAFLMNLGIDPEKVKTSLERAWGSQKGNFSVPEAEIERLARDVYADEAWTLRRDRK